MSITHPRPDLAAHRRAIQASFPQVAAQLRELLRARLVAYLGGVRESRAAQQWADGSREPSEAVPAALAPRAAGRRIAETDSPQIARRGFRA